MNPSQGAWLNFRIVSDVSDLILLCFEVDRHSFSQNLEMRLIVIMSNEEED